MNTQLIRKQISKLMGLAIAATTMAFAIPNSADAAVFAKFDGIDGESKDDKHDKWIDVLSIDWGAHKPGGGATGQSRRRGAAVVEDLTLTIEYEKASPKLQESCLTGKVIPKLEIELTKTVGGNSADGTQGRRVVYLRYELKNVLITSYSFRHKVGQRADGSEQVPTEDFSLNFEEIKVTYTEYDSEGNKGGNAETTWKVEKGEK